MKTPKFPEFTNFDPPNLNLSLTGAEIVLSHLNIIMKRIFFALAFCTIGTVVYAQDLPETKKGRTDWSKVDLGKRSADHFMLQLGYSGWAGAPDSINRSGFSRSFNFYLLFDFPFKSNPRLSVAIGPGIGTDNIFFENTRIDLKNRNQIQFLKDSVNRYKKYKMQLGYLEAPVELRYAGDPANMNKSFKFAVGVKVGTIIEGKTKAKVDLDADGDGGYVLKVKDRKFFNSTRLAATARVGIGGFSLYGQYNLTELFREGQGPQDIRPWQIGLMLSGL